MKKALVFAAALALAAAPAAAQESASPTAAAQAQSAVTTAVAPSIFVSQDEIQQRVAVAETEREGAQVGSSNWWYTVAAVALGVIIAFLLLD